MSNRIPGKELEEYRSWLAPSLAESGGVLHSAEKESRLKKKLLQQQKNEINGEPINNPKTEPMTAEKLAEISETAYQDGFAKGKEEGYEAGRIEGFAKGEQTAIEETRNIIEAKRQLLQQLVDGLIDPFEQQNDTLEGFLLEAVTQLAASVVAKELAVQPEQIKLLVQQALDALPNGANNIVVYVNEADKKLLLAEFPEEAEHWPLKVDESLGSGGCRVESSESIVDNSIQKRFQELCSAFVKGELH